MGCFSYVRVKIGFLLAHKKHTSCHYSSFKGWWFRCCRVESLGKQQQRMNNKSQKRSKGGTMLRVEEMEKKGQRYLELFATLPCPVCDNTDKLDYSIATIDDKTYHVVTCVNCNASIVAYDLCTALELYNVNAIENLEKSSRREEYWEKTYNSLSERASIQGDKIWALENPIQEEGDIEREILRLEELEALRIEEEREWDREEELEASRVAVRAGQE